MSDRYPTESANGIVTATLAIPSDAIRVTAAPPETISQKNVEAATGVPARVFLEAIREPEFPLSVTRLGKLRIVNRAAFVEWLERGAFVGRAEDSVVSVGGRGDVMELDEGQGDRTGTSDVLVSLDCASDKPIGGHAENDGRRGDHASEIDGNSL